MIRAIIIDDEEDARDALRMAVEKYCSGISVERVCATPETGIEAIGEIRPDLVFLDVQMPCMSGFDVLQRTSPVTFEVIFVSAYDKYAIKAIRFSALDFLLKPIDVDDLMQAANRVKARLNQDDSRHIYQSVLNNVQHKAGRIERLAVPSIEGIDFFDTTDIIFCKADGAYTSIYMSGKGPKLVSRNLKDFEHMLSESGFCRVHHSYLINISHVQKYIKGEGGYVEMSDGHVVDVSRRRKEEFLSALNRV